jgi:predicted transcriptional regulator
MGRRKISQKDPNSVVVNLNLRLDDDDPKMVSIAKLLRDGDFVDEKQIIHLKGKELTLYLLAARVKEMSQTQSNEIVVNKKEEVIENIPQQSQTKLKGFGIKQQSIS